MSLPIGDFISILFDFSVHFSVDLSVNISVCVSVDCLSVGFQLVCRTLLYRHGYFPLLKILGSVDDFSIILIGDFHCGSVAV